MLQINFGKKIITTPKPAFIMGIVNATPDSFFEKSHGGGELALKLIEQGADIIDIGGESTKPGFNPVDDEEQIRRIIPVINAVRKVSDIPISIDTRSSKVYKAAVDAGADVLNDVSSFESDKELVKVVAETGTGVILMHGFNISEEHETDNNICNKVIDYLKQRTEYSIAQGIDPKKILWDPGIGFGKTTEENVLLIKMTDNLCKENFPLLMALSRKRVIGFMTGKPIEGRGPGTLAADMISVQKGAKILRVHDVSDTNDMLNVMKNLEL